MNSPRIFPILLLAFSLMGCDPKPHMPGPPKPPPKYPKEVKTPIDPALQSAAKAEIKSALRSNDEVVRANALETLADQHMADWNKEILEALRDHSSLVRKAAALAAGQMKLKETASRLPELLDAEGTSKPEEAATARQERYAAIFALHQLGDTRYSHELEAGARDPNPYVRRDVAFIFGLIGDKSATPWLIEMVHNDSDVNVRLQAAESLWRMGNEDGQKALIQGTVSAYASDQMISVLALAQPRDRLMLEYVVGLFSNDFLEVRLVCARAAGMLGTDIGYGVAMEGARSVDPRDRASAALAFGAIGRSDSQKPELAKLLKDSNAEVRLAAAGALIAVGQKE